MISKTVQDAINEQIKAELHSAYIYLAMAAFCESVNLKGLAHWMRLQSREEVAHALKLFDYSHDRGGRVLLQAIPAPAADYKTPLEMMQETLEHERKVTDLINNLYALAIKENDYATQVHLQWFISEQVEEEKNAGDLVERLKMIGEDKPGLLLLDRELGSRSADQ